MKLSHLLLATIISSSSILGQIPKLNSLPQSTSVVYLDFDGQRVTGTSWNSQYTNGNPILALPSNLTTAQITEVFNRIAEDYRPFNLNITTDSTVYQSTPVNKRSMIVFTPTAEWFPNAGGGVAFINIFLSNSNSSKVGWVFTTKLGNATSNIAAAGSHESGHQFGLQHQSNYDDNCVLVAEYHAGVGTGQEAWGPIMGAPYSKNNMIWHLGKIKTGCNNIQDDLNVISAKVPYKVDDFPNTIASATSLAITNNTFSQNGLITTNTDKDMFAFTITSSSSVSITAVPFNVGNGNRGANLNIKLTLKDGNDKTLRIDTGKTFMDATLSNIPLTTGKYYIEVDGDKSFHSSDYGSLGSYTLSGTIVPQSVSGLESLIWAEQIGIYPNPSSNTITLTLGENFHEINTIEVYDVSGRKLKEKIHINTPDLLLNIQDLPTGIYQLKLTTSSTSVFKSFIKN